MLVLGLLLGLEVGRDGVMVGGVDVIEGFSRSNKVYISILDVKDSLYFDGGGWSVNERWINVNVRDGKWAYRANIVKDGFLIIKVKDADNVKKMRVRIK